MLCDDDINTAVKKLGKAIQKIRLEKNLTQDQLADMTNMDRACISDVERGIRNTYVKIIFRFAFAMGVSPSRFFED